MGPALCPAPTMLRTVPLSRNAGEELREGSGSFVLFLLIQAGV